jgi:putative membrane protein
VIEVSDLPTVNASLNATSAVLLTLGYRFIRRREIRAHRICMSAAFAVSTAFLACYVVYHWKAGSTSFTGQGLVRPIYFVILISHVLLAMAVLPLALTSLYYALRARFETHRRVARWALPVWLYVSVTGVLVYLMLYHLYPASARS